MTKNLSAKDFRDIRLRWFMTQQQMAEFLGYKHGRIVRRFESGKYKIPPPTQRLIAVFLRLPTDVFEREVKLFQKAPGGIKTTDAA